MTVLELKKLLIHRITEINDMAFLKAVMTILDTKTEKEVLLLSTEQRNEIIKAKKEIQQGLFIKQENLDEEISRWANEK